MLLSTALKVPDFHCSLYMDFIFMHLEIVYLYKNLKKKCAFICGYSSQALCLMCIVTDMVYECLDTHSLGRCLV